jgi:hypothetical protein
MYKTSFKDHTQTTICTVTYAGLNNHGIIIGSLYAAIHEK